jgi:hypothetical protein
MKKSFIVVLAVALLASAALAETEITLFSWEDQQPGFGMAQFDGYLFISAGDSEYGMAVTDGNWAMAVDLKDGWTQGLHGGIGFGWDWTPYFPEFGEAFKAGGKIRMDVTTSNVLANVPMSSGIMLGVFMQGTSAAELNPSGPVYAAGGVDFGATFPLQLIDAVYYTQYGGEPAYATSTLEWDLTVDQNGNPTWFPSLWTSEDGGWADMRIQTNVIGGATNAGIIIIDNIRVVIYDDPTGNSWGDFNNDGVVDIADYTVWADNFGQTGSGIAGDANGDGVVDIADYTIWADNFGATGPATN